MATDGKDDEFRVEGGPQAGELELFDDDEAALAAADPFRTPRRGGGSRKGVPNRRNDDFKRYYASLGLPDPLLFLGHVLARPTVELARELQCKPGVALDIQRKAAADLAPYLHSKQPAKLDVGEGDKLPVIIIGEADLRAAHALQAAGTMSIDGDLPPLQNQSLTPAASEGSHVEGSHGSFEIAENQCHGAIKTAD